MLATNRRKHITTISSDHAIVEIKPLTMMGDYNITYLIQRERGDLATVTLPYRLTTINTDQPSKLSKKLSHKQTVLSRITIMLLLFHHLYLTPRPVSADKPIDHFATSVISNIKVQPSPRLFMNEI